QSAARRGRTWSGHSRLLLQPPPPSQDVGGRDKSGQGVCSARRRAGGALSVADLTEQLPLPAERPAVRAPGVIPWLRANLFNSPLNTILTLLAVYLLVSTIPPFLRWALVDAIWSAPNGQACRGANGQEV